MSAPVHDLAFSDELLGTVVVTFDGRVLEVFTERAGSVCRLVVGLLHVDAEEPDRKGRRRVLVRSMPGGEGSGATLTVGADDWAAVGAWVSALHAALGARP